MSIEIEDEPLERRNTSELLIRDDRDQRSYFYAGEEKEELDVAEFISRSAPRHRRRLPYMESYILFAKVYGCVLLLYSVAHLIFLIAYSWEYANNGIYHGTYQFFYAILTIILYFIPGAYSVYSCYDCTAEKIAGGYFIVVSMLSVQFFLSSADIAYFAFYRGDYMRVLELMMCTILYLFGYVNHYDFHKKYKKGTVRYPNRK